MKIEMIDTDEDAGRDAIEVYREHVTVITEIKRSQWQVTNYIILVFAGPLALKDEIIAALGDYRFSVGLIVPSVLWFFGALVLWRQYSGLTRRRDRLRGARKILSRRARAVYGIETTQGHGSLRRNFTDSLILTVSLVVTAAAAALSGLLLTANY